jgi:FixJ family two-component response regulator
MDESSRISIVDDDPSVLRALGRLCKSAGYLVESYDSAEAFLDSGDPAHSACLILDVHLPGQSGLELQEVLRGTDKDLPIVFVTAFDDDDVREHALERGAAAFLSKPLNSERLLDAISDAIGSRNW